MDVVNISGDHDEFESAQITFQLHSTGDHVVVCLFKSDLTKEATVDGSGALPLTDHLIRLIGKSLITDDYDEQQRLEDEALDPIYEAAETIISSSEAAAQKLGPNQHRSLHSVLYPKSSHYRLQSASPTDGNLLLVSITPQEACTISFEDGEALLDYEVDIKPIETLPRVSTHQIQVVEELVTGGGTVCLAKVDGHEGSFLCKARRDGLQNPSLEREIDCLQRILQATSSANLADDDRTLLLHRIPMLQGYVTHPTNGYILGFLREWMPSDLSLRDLQDLNEAGNGAQASPRALRRKWADQIKETIKSLHSIGVVWGDVKASNFIVDSQNNACLIDFGGGWTEGWVDEDLKETVQGDEQGVARLLNFLGADD